MCHFSPQMNSHWYFVFMLLFLKPSIRSWFLCCSVSQSLLQVKRLFACFVVRHLKCTRGSHNALNFSSSVMFLFRPLPVLSVQMKSSFWALWCETAIAAGRSFLSSTACGVNCRGSAGTVLQFCLKKADGNGKIVWTVDLSQGWKSCVEKELAKLDFSKLKTAKVHCQRFLEKVLNFAFLGWYLLNYIL